MKFYCQATMDLKLMSNAAFGSLFCNFRYKVSKVSGISTNHSILLKTQCMRQLSNLDFRNRVEITILPLQPSR